MTTFVYFNVSFTMEKIVCSPGLQHLVEKVFWNLDAEDLKICAQINQSCKQILQNPIFCLRKFENLSIKNHKDWIEVIQSVKNFDKGIAIICYLKWNKEKDAFVDLPCYSSSPVQDDFNKRIKEICRKWEPTDEDTEIVKVLAPLTDNPDIPDDPWRTPIFLAAQRGNTEIVKILAPLTKNHNARTNVGVFTPIQVAASKGHTEIVKILAPLTDNPNRPDEGNNTPIHLAAIKGHTEIVEILAPLTDNPNAANDYGRTPIYWAACNGHTEIVKILAPLTDNPNAPCNYGRTPIYWAARNGYTEIVKILVPLTDNPNSPDISGKTPIYWAAKHGHTEIVKILAFCGCQKCQNL